jgi:hypothetical protein
MIQPGEVVIHSGNAHNYVQDPVVDGERKARGLIPRNFTTHPVGCYPSILPFHAVDFPIIPESEWSERVRDKVATKSQLSDIRLIGNAGQPIPSRDQNGKGYSHTEDTEVLTEKGWVRWPDWNHTDLLATINPVTHAMEFQAATEWHASEYRGETYHSTNRRLDFGVTNYHRMYVRKWDESRRTLSDHYSFQTADSLGWYVGMLAAPSGWRGTEMVEVEVPGGPRFDGDDFIALLALLVSDGYAGGSDKGRNVVSFCCFDERYAAVAALAARVGFTEQPGRKGVWHLTSAALAGWVRDKCYTSPSLGSTNKCVPDIVKVASGRQINLFLSWFGDRAKEGSQPVFYSSSVRLIDDLQELLLRVGKRGTIRSRPARDVHYAGKVIHGKEAYVLTVAETDRLCLDRKKHIETDRYHGLVYCATVPNGLLVTRRNGSVLISGNCWFHSGTSAQLLMRAVMGEPYADLSAYAGACKIKNFRDEGGWGAQGVDFQTEKGIPTSQFWPQKSMSKSNDNPQTWENALLHRVAEGWIDTQAQQYDRKLSRQQVATLLLSGCPVVVDYNWWGHSVCAADLVDGAQNFEAGLLRNENGKLLTVQEFDEQWEMDSDAGGFGVRIWNSWGDSWSQQGMGVLAAGKAWPDGAVGLRTVTPSNI